MKYLWDGRSLNNDPKMLPTAMDNPVTMTNQMGMTHSSFSFSITVWYAVLTRGKKRTGSQKKSYFGE